MSDLGLSFTLEAPPPTTTVRCAICIQDVPSISIFKTTKQCHHSFCGHCMSSYIAVKIKDGVANVRCPGFYCEAILDPLTCKQLVSSSQFVRWCDRLCEWSILGFARFDCPNSNCREIIINDCGGDEGSVRFKCPSCKRRGCFRDENILLLERLAKRRRWKRCPQCKIYVARRGGCNEIVCRCGARFCYGSGEKIGLFSCACRRREIADYVDDVAEYVFGVIYLCLFIFMIVVMVGTVLYKTYEKLWQG